jgi:hypothetical protein
LRALPAEEYKRLRTDVLAQAKVRLSPKWKNPGISQNGLDTAIVSGLQGQREYLNSVPVAPKDICRGPAIHLVNGKASSAIFTPQSSDNSYRIEGCSFGNIRGRLHLEPHPLTATQSALPIPLNVDGPSDGWSDNVIIAHLDSSIAGVPDSPVTLVIYPARGKRVELPGCFFVAARGEPQLLNAIPSEWIKLHPSAVRSRPIEQLEYLSPPVKGGGVPESAAGASAFVSRVDSDNFGPGADVYYFDQLTPGWVIDSVQLQNYVVTCPGTELDSKSFGAWGTQWDRRKLTVSLQDDVCASYLPPSLAFNVSLSEYALRVWVIGPRGTQPIPNALLQAGKN